MGFGVGRRINTDVRIAKKGGRKEGRKEGRKGEIVIAHLLLNFIQCVQ